MAKLSMVFRGAPVVAFPDSPAGRHVRWLFDAWLGDDVSQEEADAHFAPTFKINRFSSTGSLLDPDARVEWLAQGRRLQPVVKAVVEEPDPNLVCVLVECADGTAAWHGFLVEPEAPHRLKLNVGI